MKIFRMAILVALIGLAVSCVATQRTYVKRHYILDNQRETFIGDSIMTWEYGKGDGATKSGWLSELVFTGMSGSIIHIYYREYNINEQPIQTLFGSDRIDRTQFIRSPFAIELRYDYQQSKIIRYKDVVIEVINATPEKLTYTIKKDLAWLVEWEEQQIHNGIVIEKPFDDPDTGTTIVMKRDVGDKVFWVEKKTDTGKTVKIYYVRPVKKKLSDGSYKYDVK